MPPARDLGFLLCARVVRTRYRPRRGWLSRASAWESQQRRVDIWGGGVGVLEILNSDGLGILRRVCFFRVFDLFF